MKHMKKLMALLVLTLAIAVNAVAQDKASDVKKLFQLMQSEKMIDDMLGNMVPFMKQQMTAKSQDAESKEKFDKFVDFLMDEIKVLSNTLLNEEMVDIYNKNFTHDEILDLIAFYESPTGKKLIEKNPIISAELLQVMQTKFIPQFQEVIGKKVKEFQP